MKINVNTVTWVLLCAALVYFMQAGFALCEAGLTRAKNTGNILMKNLMDFCIGTPCFWLIGFGLMFNGTGPVIGHLDPLIRGTYTASNSVVPQTMPLWCYVIFQTVFCATAATIVSGSMAERTNFKAYCIYSAVISLIVYPISGHWIWGGGWLSQLSFHDFAGSTCVHMVGGLIACLGAALLGPRIGKYSKDGKARAIPGHNLTAMALGVFVLWFCWFGFNGGSTVAMDGADAANTASLAFMNTNLAAAVATLTTMIFTWFRYGKPDVSMTFNASLAGLVAITAGCDCVSPVGAFFIGMGNYLPRVRQNYTLGIKTPWALDDPDNWRRTHRFGGACFMVVGVSLIVLGFLGGILPETWILAVIMVLAIGSVAAMYVYSYLIWRKSHNS